MTTTFYPFNVSQLGNIFQVFPDAEMLLYQGNGDYGAFTPSAFLVMKNEEGKTILVLGEGEAKGHGSLFCCDKEDLSKIGNFAAEPECVFVYDGNAIIPVKSVYDSDIGYTEIVPTRPELQKFAAALTALIKGQKETGVQYPFEPSGMK